MPDSATVQVPRNLAESVRRAASGAGGGTAALIWQDQAMTWGELDAVLDNMVEGVFACDRSGAVTHMNAAGLRLRELSSAGAVSRAPMETAVATRRKSQRLRPGQEHLIGCSLNDLPERTTAPALQPRRT